MIDRQASRTDFRPITCKTELPFQVVHQTWTDARESSRRKDVRRPPFPVVETPRRSDTFRTPAGRNPEIRLRRSVPGQAFPPWARRFLRAAWSNCVLLVGKHHPLPASLDSTSGFPAPRLISVASSSTGILHHFLGDHVHQFELVERQKAHHLDQAGREGRPQHGFDDQPVF